MDFWGQRSLAAARAAANRWPAWRRLVFAGAAPLFPWVRGGRIVRDLRRSGRRQLLPWVLFPIAAALVAGACGEAIGYLFGGGNAAFRKAPVELQRDRFVVEGDRRRVAPLSGGDVAGPARLAPRPPFVHPAHGGDPRPTS
jgi:hypothetical protein